LPILPGAARGPPSLRTAAAPATSSPVAPRRRRFHFSAVPEVAVIRLARSLCCAFTMAAALAAVPVSEARGEIPARDAGEGPYARLVIRNVNVIDGTGAPMQGPFDVVIERDRIAQIVPIGAPGAIVASRRAAPGEREIDGTGFTLMPGFVDTHVHLHALNDEQGVPPEHEIGRAP